MSVDIGTEAAQFPEKEYINGIFVAVQRNRKVWHRDKLACKCRRTSLELMKDWGRLRKVDI
jgi:hypothetical protein